MTRIVATAELDAVASFLLCLYLSLPSVRVDPPRALSDLAVLVVVVQSVTPPRLASGASRLSRLIANGWRVRFQIERRRRSPDESEMVGPTIVRSRRRVASRRVASRRVVSSCTYTVYVYLCRSVP